MTKFDAFIERLKPRLRPFTDLTAWVLLIVSSVPLLFIDRAMFVTLIEWTLYAIALAGIAVFLSRVLLPHVRLSLWLQRAWEGDRAAAFVASSVIMFLAVIFIGVVIWARA